MSIKYRNSTGQETIIAGLTPGGDIEAGAVATRSGVATIPAKTTGDWGYINVSFDESMPDNIYEVVLSAAVSTYILSVTNKTTTGFRIGYYAAATRSEALEVSWTATKTYTVQHAEQMYEELQDVETTLTSIPASASAANKLVTQSDLTNATTPIINNVADIQDVVPSTASILNKLATQADLDNVHIDVDSAISDTSENPVQNKVIKTALDDKANQTEVNDISKVYGAKNLLSFPYLLNKLSNYYSYGVAINPQNDGTLIANGTVTSGNVVNISLTDIINDNRFAGKILNGCPTGGSSNTYYLRARIGLKDDTFVSEAIDSGNGIVIPTIDETTQHIQIGLIIKEDTTVNNLIFKPMIREASIVDDTYEPYIPTNKQLVNDLSEVINNTGVKNFIPYPYYNTTQTQNGITFTDNGDGSITVSGTATDTISFILVPRNNIGNLKIPKGRYILSGCPSGGFQSGKLIYRLHCIFEDQSSNYGTDLGDGQGVLIDVTNDLIDKYFGIFITVQSGAVITNPITFYPMLRLASDNDNIYQPYAKTNQQLTTEISTKAEQAQVDTLNVKNLIPYPYDVNAHMEYDGVVWDTIEEGTITATGQLQTTTSTTYHIMARSNSKFRKSGTYILTGCPAGGSNTTYRMQAGYADSGGTWHNLAVEYGDGVTFTYDYDTVQADLSVRCQILSASYVADNLTFHPMLRLATDSDDTWMPYAETNKQLTDRPNVFVGTTAEWNALTAYQKARYQLVNLTDDGESLEVTDAVTDGDMKPVTSNAVYDATVKKHTGYSTTVPSDWVNNITLFKKNGMLFLDGNIYTNGTGIANGARLTLNAFFPSDCHPIHQEAHFLCGSSTVNGVLTNGVTAYHSINGQTLYIDNNSGFTIKQIYFNIIALCE